MKRPLFNKLVSYLYDLHEWYLETPERSLDRAYKAALTIKAIEDEHFGGKKISPASGNYNDSVMSFFQADLKKYLDDAKYGLAEFKASRSILKITESDLKLRENYEVNGEQLKSSQALESRENQAIIIEKLKFVGEVIDKYTSPTDINVSSSLITIPKSNVVRVESQPVESNVVLVTPSSATNSPVTDPRLEPNNISEKSGVLPRSIGRTFERIQQELDPKAEAEVIKSFRKSKAKTIVSIRFLLILILVPILTQQISKNFVVSPIVERFRNPEKTEVFLNLDLEEEALRDLQKFEEILKFRNLVGLAPVISKEKIEEELKHKATEIEEEYRHKSADAIKNVFADMISLIAFCFVLVTRKREIQILKSFMDEFVYGLSDSAKAFIIILFTDIFVGFHSPHGWEVLLESVARHLGLPENRGFIFLFIATFPVILDTIFKYWIFRYLSRMSPSAVATFRNMNE